MAEIPEIISQNRDQIRDEWQREMSASIQRADLISKTELQEQCDALLDAILAGMRGGSMDVSSSVSWKPTRELLEEISATRARQGFTASQTARFVLSLKRPL